MNIEFLNHASFIIEKENYSILVDPWFSGKIFNDSWSLLRDTDDSKVDYSKLKYISISHEHPDHFHPATLKYIKSKTDNDITILFPYRKNDNVKEACEKMGFKFKSLYHFETYDIEQDFKITAFPEGHDNALVYEVDEKIILNQNDAYLDAKTSLRLKDKYPKIDLWFFQFSLAGFYGNRENPSEIYEKGTKFHQDQYLGYQGLFNPVVSVPFASFVYFCKEHNNYLNKHRVKLEELITTSQKAGFYNQVPFYNEKINFKRPWDNFKLWEEEFSEDNIKISAAKQFPEEEEIKEKFIKLIDSGYEIEGDYVFINFFDYEKVLLIDTYFKKCEFVTENQVHDGDERLGFPANPHWKSDLAGTLTGEELTCYLDMPWGADTLNISACFDVHNTGLWENFKIAREKMYVR
jgi:UDP-MurNAc hydroxylase